MTVVNGFTRLHAIHLQILIVLYRAKFLVEFVKCGSGL
jgi:hypothetical protein